jgi:lipopolysaccharide transport system ATP-binding protein
MEQTIIVENLSKQYKLGQLHRNNTLKEVIASLWTKSDDTLKNETIWALDDVSFTAKEGEVVGIIGRNGAGKSTLLKVLSKITYPTKGSVKVFGQIASLLEVGTGFHEELTGRENIFLNGSILGMKKTEIEKKLDEIIDFAGAGVEKFIDTPIKRYSSGMRLRLGFAVAAHLNPDVLVVDEVLAVGDAEFQKKCLNAMDDLRSGGRTVLFVSHNMVAVENLCPRTIWLNNGKLVEDGNSKEVIKKYLTTFIGTQKTGFELADIEMRGGNGDIRFTGIEFLDEKGRPQNLIRSGDRFFARLHYNAKKNVKNPHFGIDLYTEYGTKVTSFNTWSSGFDTPSISPGEGFINLHVDALNIMASRYYLTLWLASAGNVWYDRLDNCATLDVEESDFYNSGRGMTGQHLGVALFPCKWRHNGSE